MREVILLLRILVGGRVGDARTHAAPHLTESDQVAGALSGFMKYLKSFTVGTTTKPAKGQHAPDFASAVPSYSAPSYRRVL